MGQNAYVRDKDGNAIDNPTPEQIEAAKVAVEAAAQTKYDTDYPKWKLELERAKRLPAHLSDLKEVLGRRPTKPQPIAR